MSHHMIFREVGEEAILLQWSNRFCPGPTCGHTQSIPPLTQRLKHRAQAIYRQERFLKMDTAWLLRLRRGMSILTRIELFPQIPFLKKLLTEVPGWTIAHEDLLNRETQALTGIHIQTFN